MARIHYSNCPVCSSVAITPFLSVKDHALSKETFSIWQCSHCTLRFTQDVPDQKEMEKYYKFPDYISHSNTSKGLLNRAYQVVRKYTLSNKANLIIRHTLAGRKLLDLGAGIGAFIHTMERRQWKAIGIEPDLDARQNAFKLFAVTLKENQALSQFPPAYFDAITMWHVLEHVHDLHHYVGQLKVLLKDSGRLFIAVPNYLALNSRVYKNYWAAYDVPRHLYHFSPEAMKILIEGHGMKIYKKKQMWFDSFYIALMSSRYKRGKTNWLAAMAHAMMSNLKSLVHPNHCSSIIYIIGKI